MEDFIKLSNSELLIRYLFSRDNLISIRKRMFEEQRNPETYSSLLELFDMERQIHDALLVELFRRMK